MGWYDLGGSTRLIASHLKNHPEADTLVALLRSVEVASGRRAHQRAVPVLLAPEVIDKKGPSDGEIGSYSFSIVKNMSPGPNAVMGLDFPFPGYRKLLDHQPLSFRISLWKERTTRLAKEVEIREVSSTGAHIYEI
jgi:hypothetical protein